MSPGFAGHLEFLVSTSEDSADRDKRLLDEWARSNLATWLFWILLTIITGTMFQGTVRAAAFLTRFPSGLIVAPSWCLRLGRSE